MLRVMPEVHRRAYARARQEGKSLNQWISERLEQAWRVRVVRLTAHRTRIRTNAVVDILDVVAFNQQSDQKDCKKALSH